MQQIVLDILKEEYEKEKQTSQSLDNKANIFLSALVVIVTVWLEILPIKDIIKIFHTECNINSFIIVIILFILFDIFVINIYFLFKCLKLQNYNAVNTESIIYQANSNNDYKEYINAVIDHYQEIITNNAQINEDKAKYLKKAIKIFCINSILSIILLLLIFVFI